MPLISPELLAEFSKVAVVSVVAIASTVGVAVSVVEPSEEPGTVGPLWETDRCEAVQQALRLKVDPKLLADKLETYDLTPLDAQCMLAAEVPDVVWVAAMRSVARNHPRYRDVMWVKPGR